MGLIKYGEYENTCLTDLMIQTLRCECRDRGIKMRVVGRHSDRIKLYAEMNRAYIPGGINYVPLALAERLVVYMEDVENKPTLNWSGDLK